MQGFLVRSSVGTVMAITRKNRFYLSRREQLSAAAGEHRPLIFAGCVESDDRLTSGLRIGEESQRSAWLKKIIPAPPVSADELTDGFTFIQTMKWRTK